jgi:segregation and condensation protein A
VLARELELDLDAFEGPFDLLLTLVLKEELDLADVEVAEIVLEFVGRLAADAARPPSPAVPARPVDEDAPAEARSARGDELDLDACGEFLILVAALLELKARGLFDEDADVEELAPEEAAEELARRLAEYRRVKAAAGWLGDRLEREGDRFFRVGPAPLAPRPRPAPASEDAAALADALRRLAADPPAVSLAHLELRFPPVSRFLERFRALLRRRRRFDFDGEVEGLSRLEQAVAFLALLELRKAGEVALAQAAPFAPIRVARTGQENVARHEREAGWQATSA